MIAARSLVVRVVILDELRSIFRQGVNYSASTGIRSRLVVFDALVVHGLLLGIASFCAVRRVEVAVTGNSGHVVHRGDHRSLYASVCRCSIEADSAPAAYTDDADSFRVDKVSGHQEVYCCGKIFSVDFG